MDAIHTDFLEEYKYTDEICRDMLGTEKGVSAYIEQMERTPFVVRYMIVEWNDEYRQLKHIRRIRNQIAHSTEYVECTAADLQLLKTFHNDLLTQRDPLAKARRVEKDLQNQKKQDSNTTSSFPQKGNAASFGTTNRLRKSWILIAVIVALLAAVGGLLWIISVKK